MTYDDFLNNIEDYVGKVVEFTTRRKQDGYISKTQRYVWDSKEFGRPKADALMEVLNVDVIRDGKLDKRIKGVVGVK